MEKLKSKINIKELAIFFALIAPTAKLLILPNALFSTVGRDYYFVPLLIGLVDLLLLLFVLSFAKKEKMSFFQLAESVLGKIGAKILASFYALYFLIKLIVPLIEQHLVAIQQLYEATPGTLFFIPIYIAIAYAAFSGVKNILRTSQLFFWVLILGYLGIILLSAPSAELSEVFPSFEYGVTNFFKGTFYAPLWFGDFLLALFVMDKISFEKKARLKLCISSLVGILLVVSLFLIVLGIYGVITTKQLYILTKISKYSTAFSNIGRLDFVFVLILYFGMFLSSSLFASITTDCVQYVIGKKRALIAFSIAVVLFPLAIFFSSRFSGLLQFITTKLMPVLLIFQYVIPLLLLALGKIILQYKRKKEGSSRNKTLASPDLALSKRFIDSLKKGENASPSAYSEKDEISSLNAAKNTAEKNVAQEKKSQKNMSDNKPTISTSEVN